MERWSYMFSEGVSTVSTLVAHLERSDLASL